MTIWESARISSSRSNIVLPKDSPICLLEESSRVRCASSIFFTISWWLFSVASSIAVLSSLFVSDAFEPNFKSTWTASTLPIRHATWSGVSKLVFRSSGLAPAAKKFCNTLLFKLCTSSHNFAPNGWPIASNEDFLANNFRVSMWPRMTARPSAEKPRLSTRAWFAPALRRNSHKSLCP